MELLGLFAFVLAVAFCAAWAIVNAMIAEQKGRSFSAALIFSVFVSPLVVYLYIVAVPPLEKPAFDKEAFAQEARKCNR